jgi:hypothetical protein
MEQAVMSTTDFEGAWPGGPLRVQRTGNGKSSRYACSECLSPANGVYPLKRSSSQAETWLCATCRSSHISKREQPAGLRVYRERRAAAMYPAQMETEEQ